MKALLFILLIAACLGGVLARPATAAKLRGNIIPVTAAGINMDAEDAENHKVHRVVARRAAGETHIAATTAASATTTATATAAAAVALPYPCVQLRRRLRSGLDAGVSLLPCNDDYPIPKRPPPPAPKRPPPPPSPKPKAPLPPPPPPPAPKPPPPPVKKPPPPPRFVNPDPCGLNSAAVGGKRLPLPCP
ncbi:hypothetical protein VaNZ11_002670 [Volvox africanus]|uniref:Uncharacterized protein n=1 Tax=Volvox africanus TaxID=51714 RepID=A0ABQ5RSG7_9CHLO|nr:hypothetical protein VaNZ11_002670 [Volvox africanus]